MDGEASICLPCVRTLCPLFTKQRLCFSLASVKHQGECKKPSGWLVFNNVLVVKKEHGTPACLLIRVVCLIVVRYEFRGGITEGTLQG